VPKAWGGKRARTANQRKIVGSIWWLSLLRSLNEKLKKRAVRTRRRGGNERGGLPIKIKFQHRSGGFEEKKGPNLKISNSNW